MAETNIYTSSKRVFHLLAAAAVGAASLLAPSCGRPKCTGARVGIVRLDSVLTTGELPPDSLLPAVTALFTASGYGEPDSAKVAAYAIMPSIAVHEDAVARSFTDLSAESAGLGAMFARVHTELSDMSCPKVYTIISPFNQSVILADSMLFIGLNHYLGLDYEPYGYFPDYIARRKVRARIMPDVAEAMIRTAYPFAAEDAYPTLTQKMLYEGAVTEAVMRLADVNDRDAIGFSSDEYKWLQDNERNLWNSLAERKLLFSSDPAVIRGMTALAASTPALHPQAPGMVGRYLGHRIVSAYLASHPDAKLAHLLTPAFYASPTTLQDSGY